MNNEQGLMDEIESATLAIAALVDAESRATRFDRRQIRRAIIETAQARLLLTFELMDAIEADIDRREAA